MGLNATVILRPGIAKRGKRPIGLSGGSAAAGHAVGFLLSGTENVRKVVSSFQKLLACKLLVSPNPKPLIDLTRVQQVQSVVASNSVGKASKGEHMGCKFLCVAIGAVLPSGRLYTAYTHCLSPALIVASLALA